MMKFIPWLAVLSVCPTLGVRPVEAQPKPDTKPAITKRADVFGPDRLWTIHIKLGAKEYQAMQPKLGNMPFGFPIPKKEEPKPDPTADVHKSKGFGAEFPFVKGNIEFQEQLVKDVGIRYKGNATYMSSQQTLKRPFKIDINHYNENQKLHGMNGFALGNNAFDATRLHDALAYHLFRAAKVPASRTAFVKLALTVADKYDNTYVGVYTMMEPVDKTFLRDHFGSDKGMLMKPERVQGLQYLGENWDAYKDKYNPKREPSKAEKRRFIEFVKLVNQADVETFNKKIGEYLDMDEFLRFAAVNSLIANLDSFFGMGHNYFLYLSPKDNRFHFIPWDLDLSFGGFFFAGQDQTDWTIAQPYLGKNRLAERVLAVKANDALYRQHLRKLTDGAFSVKEMKTAIDAMEATIKDAVAKEPAPKFGMGMPFGGKQMGLREFVSKRNESVIAQLDGKSKGKVLTIGFGPGGPGGPGKGPGGFGLGNLIARPIIDAADTNKDGNLSLTEFKEAAAKLFKHAGGDDKTPVDEKTLSETIDRLMVPKGGDGFKPPQPPKGFGPGRPLAGAILKESGAGADKKLTRDQLLTGAEKLFKQWDKNTTGQLDEKRLAEGINSVLPPPKFGPGPGGPGFGIGNALAKPIFDAADTDNDGKLSRDEFTKAAARLFKAAGGDEKTPVQEKQLLETIDGLMPAPAPPKGFGPGRSLAGAILKQAGAGEDQKLTRAQFMAGAEKLFKQWDKDQTGHLDMKRLAEGINSVMPPPAFGPGPGIGPPPFGDPKKGLPGKDAFKEKRS